MGISLLCFLQTLTDTTDPSASSTSASTSPSTASPSSESPTALDLKPLMCVSEGLHHFSNELIPDDSHVYKCHRIGLEVATVLEKEMGSTVNGVVMVVGSYGKGTAISYDSDYDIVIFFKHVEPPFVHLLSAMEAALRKHEGKFKDFRWGYRSTIHIYFEIDGIRFDVAPATQFDSSVVTLSRWCCFVPPCNTPYPSQQYFKALNKISQLCDPVKNGYLYSSSLSIDAVMFVQRQNPFVHAVIRVAKHWARRVNTGRLQVRGRSLLAETIAIHSCYTLYPFEMMELNMDKAFTRFLEQFRDASTTRLYVLIYYSREEIPDEVFNQIPLVLDPINPFNNLLNPTNFPPRALKCFQETAKSTLAKIKAWRQNPGTDMAEFRKIFEVDKE